MEKKGFGLHWDVIIIGSGISSLTAANLLAKKGKSVAVFERYRKPGGYLHTFSRFGLEFDTGSHYVGGIDAGQPFRTLLEYLDVFDEDVFLPLNRDGFDVFRLQDWEFAMPAGHDQAVHRLIEYFPKEAVGIRRYFQLVSEVARSFPTYEFDERADANAMVSTLSISLKKVVEELIQDPRLRNVFYAYCTLHCVAPEHTPFGFHAVMTDSLLRGAYGFRNGGAQLAQRLLDRLEAHGGKVFLRNGIVDFDVDDKVIKRVTTKRGEEHTAEWIISGIHPKATFSLVGDSQLSPAFRSRLAGLQESVGLLGIYGACRTPPPLDIDRNYYAFSSDNPRDFTELYAPTRGRTDCPKGVYLSRNNRSHRPNSQGYYPLTIHAPGPIHWFNDWRETRFADRPPAYHEAKREAAEAVVGFCDQIFPGIGSSLAEMEVSTPLSNLHYNGSFDGSAYGIYHSIENTGARGLGPRTHVRNLLITGQSTLFPGLLASSISGLRSAGHIVGMKGVLKELRQMREG